MVTTTDQTDETAFKVTIGAPEHVDAAGLVELGNDDFARRLGPQTPGVHRWVVGLIYNVVDPETALDRMILGGGDLLGFYPIHCLFCLTAYQELKDLGFPECVGVVTSAGTTPNALD